jgi:hypothetical protein
VNVAMAVAFINSVQPSAAALTTSSVPMLPVAPARFSITIVLFSAAESRSATARAPMSVAPPTP